MNPNIDVADLTWTREITYPTPPMPNRSPKNITGKVVLVLSPLSMATAIQPFIRWDSEITKSSRVREHTYKSPFVRAAYDRAWASAMEVIRDLGEAPDLVVSQAAETVELWRNHPFPKDAPLGQAEDDEI